MDRGGLSFVSEIVVGGLLDAILLEDLLIILCLVL